MDKESIALHGSLLKLYLGRLRFHLFGWLALSIRLLMDLQSFNTARSTIEDAKDIHLHSRVDVLAYRAVVLAYLHRCREAREDLDEVDCLIKVLEGQSENGTSGNSAHRVKSRRIAKCLLLHTLPSPIYVSNQAKHANSSHATAFPWRLLNWPVAERVLTLSLLWGY